MTIPEYAENIIVGIQNSNNFNWYILDKFLCLLDLSVLSSKERELYMQDKSLSSVRENLITINENNLGNYLRQIDDKRISCEQLQLMIFDALGNIETCNIDDFFPVLFFDFDGKTLYSQYPEYFDFENFLIDGWKFKYEKFSDLIREEHKYWVYKDRNIIEEERNLREQFYKNKYSVKFNQLKKEKNFTNVNSDSNTNTKLVVYREKNIFEKIMNFIKSKLNKK